MYDPGTIDRNRGVALSRQPDSGGSLESGRRQPAEVLPGSDLARHQQQPLRTPWAAGPLRIFPSKSTAVCRPGRIFSAAFRWKTSRTSDPTFSAIRRRRTRAGPSRSKRHSDDSYSRGRWILHGNYGYAPAAAKTVRALRDSIPCPRISRLDEERSASGQCPTITLGVFRAGPEQRSAGHCEVRVTRSRAIRAMAGRHTVKFGGTYRVNRASIFQRIRLPAASRSRKDSHQLFNGNAAEMRWRRCCWAPHGEHAGSVGYEPQPALQVPYVGFYFQDDWRVNKRLTLNLGLRWDADRPLTERFDRTSWFDFNATLPIQAPGLPPLRGGLVFANRNGTPRGQKDPDNNNFAPRVGLAYKVSNHFVLRSGFGMFYSPTTGIGPNATNSGGISYNAITNVTTSIDGKRTPFTTLSNPFPQGFNSRRTDATACSRSSAKRSTAWLRDDRVPYTVQWNFDAAVRAAATRCWCDVGYAGTPVSSCWPRCSSISCRTSIWRSATTSTAP